jgi:hypothetical protein
MAKYAIIDSTSKVVVNVTEWDGIHQWSPPAGTTLLTPAQTALPNCQIGAAWTGSSFTPAIIPTPPQYPIIHWAIVNAINLAAVQPLQLTRTWMGITYTYSCYVSETIVQLYQAGNLLIGDYVLVGFADEDLSQPLAITKVHKTW